MKGRRSLQEQTVEQTKRIFKEVRFNLDQYREMSEEMYRDFGEMDMQRKESTIASERTPTYEDLNNVMWDMNHLNYSLSATIDGVELVVKLLANLIDSTLQTKLQDKRLYLDVPKEIQRELRFWFKRQEEMSRAMRDFGR